jgi:hypothetical protein
VYDVHTVASRKIEILSPERERKRTVWRRAEKNETVPIGRKVKAKRGLEAILKPHTSFSLVLAPSIFTRYSSLALRKAYRNDGHTRRLATGMELALMVPELLDLQRNAMSPSRNFACTSSIFARRGPTVTRFSCFSLLYVSQLSHSRCLSCATSLPRSSPYHDTRFSISIAGAYAPCICHDEWRKLKMTSW